MVRNHDIAIVALQAAHEQLERLLAGDLPKDQRYNTAMTLEIVENALIQMGEPFRSFEPLGRQLWGGQ
jgi:hypothetical protein